MTRFFQNYAAAITTYLLIVAEVVVVASKVKMSGVAVRRLQLGAGRLLQSTTRQSGRWCAQSSRCPSTAPLRPMGRTSTPAVQAWRQKRYQSGAAAAMYVLNVISCRRSLTSPRQEQATADPSSLAQETIIENLDPAEAARLSKVRNIGIAVRLW